MTCPCLQKGVCPQNLQDFAARCQHLYCSLPLPTRLLIVVSSFVIDIFAKYVMTVGESCYEQGTAHR